MSRYYAADDHCQPLMWVRGHGIYATHFVVLIFALSLIATSVAMSLHLGWALDSTLFSTPEVFRGQLWRFLTYGLYNPPSISFAVDMVLMALFGREVEKFFGHKRFIQLSAGLYLLPPLFFTAIGFWWPTEFYGESVALATFVAFATLYPDVVVCYEVLAKWAAVILVGVFAMIHLAHHDWTSMVSLALRTAFAFSFVRYLQGRITLLSFKFWQRKPRLRVLPDLKSDETISINLTKASSATEMDALLDKIAKSGMSSLTAKERAQLAKAREEMMQKKSARS